MIQPPYGPYVLMPSAPNDVDAISLTVAATIESVCEHGFEHFDFESLKPEHVHGEHLAAALRATSSYRKRIPGWEHGLKVARIALGKDADDALYGLEGEHQPASNAFFDLVGWPRP